jgi:hypothetical protein
VARSPRCEVSWCTVRECGLVRLTAPPGDCMYRRLSIVYSIFKLIIHAVGSFSEVLSLPTLTLEWETQPAEIQAPRPMLREPQSGSHEKGVHGKRSRPRIGSPRSSMPRNAAHNDMEERLPPTRQSQLPSSKGATLFAGPSSGGPLFGKSLLPGPPSVEDSARSSTWTQWADLGPLLTSPGVRACQVCTPT